MIIPPDSGLLGNSLKRMAGNGEGKGGGDGGKGGGDHGGRGDAWQRMVEPWFVSFILFYFGFETKTIQKK